MPAWLQNANIDEIFKYVSMGTALIAFMISLYNWSVLRWRTRREEIRMRLDLSIQEYFNVDSRDQELLIIFMTITALNESVLPNSVVRFKMHAIDHSGSSIFPKSMFECEQFDDLLPITGQQAASLLDKKSNFLPFSVNGYGFEKINLCVIFPAFDYLDANLKISWENIRNGMLKEEKLEMEGGGVF